ncbi:alpha/beta fold hydrolase [Rubripirellula tenax]|uniref:alpha/beta fold hydrolase n=1 Tax=Rubripirellula tenax TaxID=2528015 RepID=UPI0016451BF7|nr:alpha/beta fold hydrolase [Rubripirellula tenax]
MQTIATIGEDRSIGLSPTPIRVPVSDGDSIVLHEDLAKGDLAKPVSSGGDSPGSVLLVHGLTGCHAAPYMTRLADRFARLGMRVYRMDMRGFGAAKDFSTNLAHAGRSDDCLSAISMIADRNPDGPIFAIGVSLGGGQLLRGMGRIGGGIDAEPEWIDRFAGLVAISPPLNLTCCSDNMQRLRLRLYNRYFIRSLLSRIPPGVRAREDFAACIAAPRPRTLRELDDRFTAPLSGFADAAAYYDASSSCHVVDSIGVNTLVLTAADDPIVPVECFINARQAWSPTTQLIVSPSGGHAGFIDRQRRSWMDEVVLGWVTAAMEQRIRHS